MFIFYDYIFDTIYDLRIFHGVDFILGCRIKINVKEYRAFSTDILN